MPGDHQMRLSTPTPTQALIAQAIAALPLELFAILDGGLHDDVARQIMQHELRARAIFLEAGNAAAVASGPFLVPLDAPAQIEGVIAISGHGRTPVVWSWPNGEQELYRHLRRQNMAEIPAAAAEIDADEPAEPTYDNVIFRHWDPYVLALTLPVLTPEQTSRLMGPATGLGFAAEGDGPRLLPASAPLAAPPRPLRFSAEQLTAMERARGDAINRNIAQYLRRSEPEAVAALDEAGLLAFVRRAAARGVELGMSSEHALGLWAWLMLCTGGAAATSREIALCFSRSDVSPNLTMARLIDQMVDIEQAGGRAG